jgi:hypothetical protein
LPTAHVSGYDQLESGDLIVHDATLWAEGRRV